jgi:hypothetical protein
MQQMCSSCYNTGEHGDISGAASQEFPASQEIAYHFCFMVQQGLPEHSFILQ